MISPAIAGNDSRCSIALRVFLGEFSAISSNTRTLRRTISLTGFRENFDLNLPKADFRNSPHINEHKRS
jgi:hypothetical protein